MSATVPDTRRIVVASDNVTDATMVKALLEREHPDVHAATETDAAVEAFDRATPAVLVLAFDSLEKAQSYYLGICRHSTTVHRFPHRTVVLCNQAQLRQAYDLCRRRLFDDYVLFWPLSHDAFRLAMAVHNCLRELAAGGERLVPGVRHAESRRRSAELDAVLERSLALGGEHAEGVDRAVSRAGHSADVALERLASRLAGGAPNAGLADPASRRVEHEIERVRSEEMEPGFQSIKEAVGPLRAWVSELDDQARAHRESSQALDVLAATRPPTVLVVDDDALQRRLIAHILGAEDYRLEFAQDGLEALMIARRVALDLVLMDVMMPGMDGTETTRHLRALPGFALVPIVMMTGKSVGNVVVDCLRAGATDFVVKPLDRGVLLGKVAGALHRKERAALVPTPAGARAGPR